MTTTPVKKSQPYEENVQAALAWVSNVHVVSGDPDQVSIQLAQVHAQLAIAAAIRGIWMDCDC